MELEIRPVTADLWPALEDLFRDSSTCTRCWCMYWRMGPAYRKRPGTANRAALEAIVEEGPPPGLLAFAGDVPVGWCQITPRDALPHLERDRRLRRVDDLPVWAISCFYVRKGYRRRGVTGKLITAALAVAKRAGAPAVEAYPLDGEVSPSASFTGYACTFARAGFRVVARNAPSRPILRFDLAPAEAPAKPASIDAYLNRLPEAQRRALARLRQLIHRAAPDATEYIAYGLPAFRLRGRPLVAFGAAARHCAFYPMSAKTIDDHREELAQFRTSKGTIRFQPEAPLPAALVRRLVKARIDENEAKRARAGKWSMAENPRRESKASRAASRPLLLAGGNPQIAKADGDRPVQAYIDAMPGWKRDIGRRLDALIVRTVPGVRKAVRWNSPFYGTDRHGWFLNVHCVTKYVKVAFFAGASLSPLPPVASKGEGTRYVHLYEGDPLDERLLESWIKQAAGLPGWRGFTCRECRD